MKTFAALLVLLLAGAAPALSDVITYDDGTPENWIAGPHAGMGCAVRFSVTPGTVLQGAQIWVEAPFFNPLMVFVLKASGPGGSPGTAPSDTIVASFRHLLTRGLGFTSVNFPTAPVLQDTAIYICAQQFPEYGGGFGDATAFGLDQSSPSLGRSLWYWLDPVLPWTPLDPGEGNLMIRAVVDVPVPTSTSSWGAVKGVYRQGARSGP